MTFYRATNVFTKAESFYKRFSHIAQDALNGVSQSGLAQKKMKKGFPFIINDLLVDEITVTERDELNEEE